MPNILVPAVPLGDPIHLCIYSPGPGINCDQQSFKELKNNLKTVLASNLEFNCFLLQGNKYFLSIGFRFQGIANISSYVFHTFCLIYPALSDKYFLSIGFHKTCHFFRYQGIANIPNYFFPPFLFDTPIFVRQKISKNWFPQDLSFFQISRNCKYFKFVFDSICLIYPSLSDDFFLGFATFVIFFVFKDLQIFQVMFSALFV